MPRQILLYTDQIYHSMNLLSYFPFLYLKGLSHQMTKKIRANKIMIQVHKLTMGPFYNTKKPTKLLVLIHLAPIYCLLVLLQKVSLSGGGGGTLIKQYNMLSHMLAQTSFNFSINESNDEIIPFTMVKIHKVNAHSRTNSLVTFMV